jgi:hypothetical protein
MLRSRNPAFLFILFCHIVLGDFSILNHGEHFPFFAMNNQSRFNAKPIPFMLELLKLSDRVL